MLRRLSRAYFCNVSSLLVNLVSDKLQTVKSVGVIMEKERRRERRKERKIKVGQIETIRQTHRHNESSNTY